ncbi:MAG: hypothetical protein MUE30_06895 [Spirosomaceae bacterium]|jgi:hypothetical protein|nr:hypothetical protein [Spirosomataceae bacterium]
MQKVRIFLMMLCLGIVFQGFSQTTTAPAAATDFYAGKWELLVIGTPNGDAVMDVNLARKDGKFEGTLTAKVGDAKEETKLTNVEEADGKITIFFTIQSYDVNIALEKVDDDNLKGTLMGMFEAKAKRIKE